MDGKNCKKCDKPCTKSVDSARNLHTFAQFNVAVYHRHMSDLYTTVSHILESNPVDPKALAAAFDGATHEQRLDAVHQLTGKQQSKLWTVADGFMPLTDEYFVPKDVPPLQEVIHWGKNSLPVFTQFQKRFCRKPADAGAPVASHPKAGALDAKVVSASPLWGYNHQTMQPFTGPGYYVARNADHGEVVVDYMHVPPGKPESWPPILKNGERLSRVVYYGMQDFMRGVSKHVTIGRAKKNGQWMNNWFLLLREDRKN